MPLNLSLAELAAWLNRNQGVLSLALFVAAALFGWLSGIFTSLRRKPRFKINLLHGPTFYCKYPTGREHNSHDAHQLGFALYLKIANIGSAPSSIDGVHIGYHWDLKPWSQDWLKYTLGWFWLDRFNVSLEDFQLKIGDHLKVYPFLFQQGQLTSYIPKHFLQPGQSTIGMVYFEQAESWGGCQPRVISGGVRVKIRVLDVFGRGHLVKATIPALTLEEARNFNPSFGKTHSQMSGARLPHDEGI